MVRDEADEDIKAWDETVVKTRLRYLLEIYR